jgi:hypothetical protein
MTHISNISLIACESSKVFYYIKIVNYINYYIEIFVLIEYFSIFYLI